MFIFYLKYVSNGLSIWCIRGFKSIVQGAGNLCYLLGGQVIFIHIHCRSCIHREQEFITLRVPFYIVNGAIFESERWLLV